MGVVLLWAVRMRDEYYALFVVSTGDPICFLCYSKGKFSHCMQPSNRAKKNAKHNFIPSLFETELFTLMYWMWLMIFFLRQPGLSERETW